MASGDLPWSLAEPLRKRLPGTEGRDVHLASLRRDAPPEVPQRGQERDVVLVLRDPVRHRWQLELIPQATVIVDVGWPAELDTRTPVIRTRGIAPKLLDAAAMRLAEG
jgi:hypothetical protein